ncbi:MAG: 3-dehydroquinate synthase [Planctomycetaceae bacterium]|nr:3-dehydroquinate synthase [Planctomycetaceae bacterium]
MHVALAERSYDIAIGTGNLSEAGSLATGLRRVTHAALITDSHVEPTHARTVAESLAAAEIAVDVLVVEPGEATKSVETADALWQKLLEIGADRRTLVVAVGGGVIGDLAGFVAATFTRGLGFLQVPTTLLAQVDSSVGGKVGVNLPAAKNMVGAFWQPLGVLIDTAVLETLPEREYRAGLAEVVKYGVILDADFFAALEKNVAALNTREPNVLRQVIARSCELKAQVVSRDEREETGLRAVLNYGHTFCHAIEAVTGYGEFLHGEAVSIGMLCASRLAERLGRIGPEVTARQQTLLSQLGLPVELPRLDAERLLNAMAHDKKTEHGKLRFVLPTRLGEVELVGDVPTDLVRGVLGASQ